MNSLPSTLERQEGLIHHGQPPHLSFSRINKYLTCPEQYRLYYVEGLRLKFPSASLFFGQDVHLSLADHFHNGTDPVGFFQRIWGEAKAIKLTYAHRDSWESLNEKGQKLLEKFMIEERHRLSEIEGVEQPFELSITNLDLPFVGVIDLTAKLDGTKTIVDFKTASSAYADYEVELSDQLTAYRLAEPDAEQLALCVLIKTKEPKIEWHLTRRDGDQLTEFLDKASLIGQDITARRFYKRPGKHCAWCDFLPMCLGDQSRIAETSIQVE